MKSHASAAKAAPALAAAPDRSLTLLWCMLGLLVPRASLYGELAPFGIGLAAAVTAGRLPVLLCLCVGYLLAQPVLLPLRYVATVGMVGGIRWVLAAVPKLDRRPYVPPLLAFLSTTLTGLILLSQGGLDTYRTLLILAEGAVAAGGALVFSGAIQAEQWLRQHPHEGGLSQTGQVTVTVAGAIAVMAASTLEVNGFAPGRVIASFLILILARSGRETGGSTAGVILGGAMALVTPGQAPLAIALAFGGLMAGLFSRFGKVAEAALFLLSAGVVTLGEVTEKMPIYLYELFAADVLFCLLPREWEQKLNRLFIRSRDLPAVEGVRRMMGMRLRMASGALTEVAQSVGTVSRRLAQLGAPDTGTLYRNCRTAVCGSCPMQEVCWGQHQEEMQSGLEALTPLLEQGGVLTADRIGGYPGEHCRRVEQLADYIAGEYQRHIAREGAWQRLRDIQQAAEDQFSGTSELLRSLAGQLEDPRQVDTDLSGQVLTVCEDYGMQVVDALCTRDAGNRLTVDILAVEGTVPSRHSRWAKHLRQVCGREFADPVVAQWGEQVRITLSEPPRYTVRHAIAQLCNDQEKLCGDAADVFAVGGGLVAMVSDGMGSGGRAAVDSSMTVGIASRLWKAGFSPAGILQTVNAALMVKSREESLSTLDVAIIDTRSGRLDSYKAGAAVTLLKSGGRVSRLERSSLPVGILPAVQFEHSHDLLSEGDVLLLVSDGALAGGVAAVEELLRDYPADAPLQPLADSIVTAARQAAPEHQDDITAVVLQLTRTAADADTNRDAAAAAS